MRTVVEAPFHSLLTNIVDSPYTAPSAPDAESEAAALLRSKKFVGRAALVFGLGVVLPPLVGLAGTVMGMAGAFGELNETGSADPSELAGHISVALLTTLWGMIISALCLVPFIVFLVLF